jgi:hypothetical protein
VYPLAGREVEVLFRAPWANADGAGVDGIKYIVECRAYAGLSEWREAMWTAWCTMGIASMHAAGCDVRAVALLPRRADFGHGYAQIRFVVVRYRPNPTALCPGPAAPVANPNPA